MLQTGIFLEELPLKPRGLETSYQPSVLRQTYLTGEFHLKKKPSLRTRGIQEMENVFCVGKKWRLKQRPICMNICSSIHQEFYKVHGIE